MLISESYRELNRQLHSDNPRFGVSGKRYVKAVEHLSESYGSREILDYGCGKRTLEAKLGFPITNYDPCLPGLDVLPEPHDIVICTDVLEHIEPECLEDVLKDLRRCTKKVALLLIATRPAGKTLADGRNAHLIQQPYEWWRDEIVRTGFAVLHTHPMEGEFMVLCA